MKANQEPVAVTKVMPWGQKIFLLQNNENATDKMVININREQLMCVIHRYLHLRAITDKNWENDEPTP